MLAKGLWDLTSPVAMATYVYEHDSEDFHKLQQYVSDQERSPLSSISGASDELIGSIRLMALDMLQRGERRG